VTDRDHEKAARARARALVRGVARSSRHRFSNFGNLSAMALLWRRILVCRSLRCMGAQCSMQALVLLR
jgi:hypothetical protein